MVYAGLVVFMLKTEAAQGRLLFPALVPLSLGLAYGLSYLSKGKQWLIWPALAFITTIYTLLGVIRPAYALPEPLKSIPSQSQFGPITFNAGDGALQLIGVEVPPDQNTTPGGSPVELALYWQAASPVEKDYLSAIHLLGREFESSGSVNRYPVKGMLPTSLWQPGQIWRDVYHIPVNDGAIAPAQLRISVSLYDSDVERPLPATWANGASADFLLVGEPIRLATKTDDGTPPPQFTNLDIPFEENIRLVGYRLADTAVPGQTLPITLYWQAAGTPTQDYTVFVQLLDANSTWLAGGDAPPVNNFYPTSMWRVGDFIDDLHTLVLPADLSPGTYKIYLGLYDPITGVRLHRLDITGDAVDIPIEVSK
jgi:hypothetical protein